MGNPQRQPKTALLLSAGGMFGAYQAGAYQQIRAAIEPDIVVGASVGALNGWPIAGGCAPGELVERWLDPATGGALTHRPGAGLKFDPEALRRQTQALYREYTPLIPFGLVVTRVAGLRRCLVRNPDVTAEHLYATASIPFVFPPVHIGGESWSDAYVDGGVLERLPVWAAVEMGATRIIAVDCLKVGEWWAKLLYGLRGALKRRVASPADLEMILITPAEPLGRLTESVTWERDRIRRWIESGARDATRELARHPDC